MKIEKITGWAEAQGRRVIATPKVASWKEPRGAQITVKMNSYKLLTVYVDGGRRFIASDPEDVIRYLKTQGWKSQAWR